MSDLGKLLNCQETSARYLAELGRASARLELAKVDEHCAYLISQHEPIASLDINREQLRLVLRYIKYGDMDRLVRSFKLLKEAGTKGMPS